MALFSRSESDSPASRKGTLFRFVVWGGFGVVVFGVSALAVLSGAVRGERISAPALAGRSLEEARSVAMARGLRFRIEDRRHSRDVPEGHVLDQRPPAGFPLKEGKG